MYKKTLLTIISALCLVLVVGHLQAQTDQFRVLGGVPHLPVFANTGAVTTPATGMFIYSTADAQPMVYNGTAWQSPCDATAPTGGVSTFQVVGKIPYLPVRASVTVSPDPGSLYYSSADNNLKVYSGSAWVNASDLASGAYTDQSGFSSQKEVIQIPVLAADPAPTGLSEGAIYINSADKNIKWYDGAAWQSLSCNAPPVVSSINATGCGTIGGVFTASATVSDPESDPLGTTTYQWYYNTTTSGSGTVLTGETATTYTVGSPVDVSTNKYVRIGATAHATAGTLDGAETYSEWMLISTNAAPYFMVVGQGGCKLEIGWSLGANGLYVDCESDAAGTHLYQWYRADDENGTNEQPISSANTQSYTLVAADENKYIRVYMTPKASSGTLTGSEVRASTFSGPVMATGSFGDGTMVVDVTNSTTGKTWMDRNLGALWAATSSDDEGSYGSTYQWGRASDGHQCRTSSNTATHATTAEPSLGNSWDTKFITSGSAPYDWLSTQDDNLWDGVGATNNPCPTGYRLPTQVELDNERASWSSNNTSGAFSSALKLPVAGYRSYIDGTLGNVGSRGYYWSSTVTGINAYYLSFGSSFANMYSNYRGFGCAVRCIKD